MSTFSNAPKKSFSTKNLLIILSALLVLAVLFAGIFLAASGDDKAQIHNPVAAAQASTVSQPDSGVEACKSIAADLQLLNALGPNAPHTDAELVVAVTPFKASKFVDLQVAGTNAMTAILDVNKKVADDNVGFAEAMASYAKAQAQWGLFQQACASHAVQVPPLPDNQG